MGRQGLRGWCGGSKMHTLGFGGQHLPQPHALVPSGPAEASPRESRVPGPGAFPMERTRNGPRSTGREGTPMASRGESGQHRAATTQTDPRSQEGSRPRRGSDPQEK